MHEVKYYGAGVHLVVSLIYHYYSYGTSIIIIIHRYALSEFFNVYTIVVSVISKLHTNPRITLLACTDTGYNLPEEQPGIQILFRKSYPFSL